MGIRFLFLARGLFLWDKSFEPPFVFFPIDFAIIIDCGIYRVNGQAGNFLRNRPLPWECTWPWEHLNILVRPNKFTFLILELTGYIIMMCHSNCNFFTFIFICIL